ncbi:hypothetical protein [Bacillus sp. NPDC094106]|uniref:hypothetical protein n=1 Tax=Bacillus sp. NPDC094106 TaxID=3363949 RepID=UPI0038038FC3
MSGKKEYLMYSLFILIGFICALLVFLQFQSGDIIQICPTDGIDSQYQKIFA